MEPIPYGSRIHQLSKQFPADEVALLFAAENRQEQSFTWTELDHRSTQLAFTSQSSANVRTSKSP